LYLAEDLVRLRRADEFRRHAAAQRAARIDPNPHQIDAVMFALARIPEGGCILADEVGLGKTIEAGLVIAQLLGEGARRVLVVTPKSLLGQWKQELYELFGIEAREVRREPSAFAGSGVFLATRDHVGSEAGAEALRDGERFDLCVVDEAHEVFAGIYRRFERLGAGEESPYARMAGRLARALREAGTPVLLLTATPIQNSLLELWGLVHYVDPSGTLLGDLHTFRDVFCPEGGRTLLAGQEHELQRRLTTVLRRTLRREAQEFLDTPFVHRQARTFEYAMSPEERALYEDVTNYLLEPRLCAFQGRQRTLLLIGFHRRMASSLPALAASLEKVAERLSALLAGADVERAGGDLADLEEDGESSAEIAAVADDEASDAIRHERAAVAAELARVVAFAERARSLPTDSKARAFLDAIRLVSEQAALGRSSGKVVVFTESLTTQDYLRQLLLDSRTLRDDEITTFRGVNDSPRAQRAVERWQAEVGSRLPPESRPSSEVAVRLALVQEFRERSRVLISTEAGAKGLNLQFCDTVINYDLPWNPQRIEQRIGRCHRYGQQRDVTVINFLARDNAAQRLTYEILSQKLELFGAVLGASDEVLHRPGEVPAHSLVSAVGQDFEAQLGHIYQRARTLAEIERELKELRDSLAERRRTFEEAQHRTESVIRQRFGVTVQQSFRRIQADLPRELEEFDRQIERVVCAYLDAVSVAYRIEPVEGGRMLRVPAAPGLPPPLRDGVDCLIGSPPARSPLFALHLGHPLMQAALDQCRDHLRGQKLAVRVQAAAPALAPLRGARGRLRVVRVAYRGYLPTDRLLPVVVRAGGSGPLSTELAGLLLAQEMSNVAYPPAPSVPEPVLADAVEEAVFEELASLGAQDHPRFERTLEQVERFLGDRVLLLEQRRARTLAALSRAQEARDAAVSSQQRDRAEDVLSRAQRELEDIDSELGLLRAGQDDTYVRWRQIAEQRRFAENEVTVLVEAEFEVA
jgi:hypothetical protein